MGEVKWLVLVVVIDLKKATRDGVSIIVKSAISSAKPVEASDASSPATFDVSSPLTKTIFSIYPTDYLLAKQPDHPFVRFSNHQQISTCHPRDLNAAQPSAWAARRNRRDTRDTLSMESPTQRTEVLSLALLSSW